jgi:hypothetical protein
MSFIPASIITLIVREREDLVKHQQLVSGLSITSYWLSNYLVDFVKHLFPAAICIAMVVAFNISAFNDSSETLGITSLLFILYGWAMMPFTYLVAFLFEVNYFYFILKNLFIELWHLNECRLLRKFLAWFTRCCTHIRFTSHRFNTKCRFSTVMGI